MSLLKRDRKSGFGPVQTPCYKQHKLCKERSQGNIQFDFYCSLKLQDTPHLTRPNEIKNSTLKYKTEAPQLALCNNNVLRSLRTFPAALLTPYSSARLVINHKILSLLTLVKVLHVMLTPRFGPSHNMNIWCGYQTSRSLCYAFYCTVFETAV